MDEVPGKKLQADSSALDVTYCQPCSQDGETLSAEAYCTVCKEFMCSTCTKVHKKQRMTKSHTLLDKSSMPFTMRHSLIEEERTESCAVHPGEFIKYFCLTHRTLNCGHCSVLNHKSCSQQIIFEIAEAFKNGPGYEDIKQLLAELLNDIDACASNVEDNIKLVEQFSEREITKLREYRNQINKYYDEREKALLNIITQMENMDKTLLDTLKPRCDKLKSQVNEIKPKLETQEHNASQLFIEAQKAKILLKEMQSTLAEINKEKKIQMYQFRKDPVSDRMLASKTGLGTIEEMGITEGQDQMCERAVSTKQDKGKWNTTLSDADVIEQVVLDVNTAKSDAVTNVNLVGDLHVNLTQNITANTTAPNFGKQKSSKGRKKKKNKGRKRTTTTDADINVQAGGDTQVVQRNKVSDNIVHTGLPYLPYLYKAMLRHPDLAISDVTMALGPFSDLRPKEDVFEFDNGIYQTLLQLNGTIPVLYKGTLYNFPICIWLMEDHPFNAPMVFVKPTSTMQINSGTNVAMDGKISLPYLRDWTYPDSNLCRMIQSLIVVFEERTPVYRLKTNMDALVHTN